MRPITDQRLMNDIDFRAMARKLLVSVAILVLAFFLIPVPEAYAAEQTVEIGIPTEEHPELFLTRTLPTRGEGKIVVFLIDFPDQKNDNAFATKELYEKIYFGGGEDDPSYFTNAIAEEWNGSVSGFYERESGGKLHLSGQVLDWYTAKHERSYYDNRGVDLIQEAAQFYASQGLDFTRFDGDGDGVIDAVTVHFGGEYSTDRNSPWYSGTEYETTAPDGFGTLGGLTFKTYVMIAASDTNNALSEHQFALSKLPVICHELMHSLGMFDMYSMATGFGLSPVHDLMDENTARINPYTKMLLGWVDRVRVITEDTDDVRLDFYPNDPGEFVLVTKEYKGIFDEFYLVAWLDNRYESAFASVWHIDGRLNADGSAFLYDNITYLPRPDIDNPHATGNNSPHPLVEQICGDPNFNFFLDGEYPTPNNISVYGFGSDSVIGPNERLSSDTHDGEYTGIRMDDFETVLDDDAKAGRYMTFDVSFVKDATSPTLITNAEDINLLEMLTLNFSENVYAGENWDQIRVLDSQGNPLPAKVILPYYPNNRMEVTFETDGYQNGFSIVLPEGCLKDSSGNALAAMTLTKEAGNRLNPVQTEQLPGVEGIFRDTVNVFVFNADDDILVISFCWAPNGDGTNTNGSKLEFMRLDRYGNVLLQNIVDNPFANANGFFAGGGYQTAQGHYIFWSDGLDVVFCMDEQGALLWTRAMSAAPDDSLFQFETLGQTTDGMIGKVVYQKKDSEDLIQKRVLIRATDGAVIEINEAEEVVNEATKTIEVTRITYGIVYNGEGVYLLSDGRQLRKVQYETMFFSGSSFDDGNYSHSEFRNCLQLVAVDGETILAEVPFDEDLSIYSAFPNSDGTISLLTSTGSELNITVAKVLLLDADLRIIRSVTLEKSSLQTHSLHSVNWLDNDGFIDVDRIQEGNHSDNRLYVRRYDRYFNLVWETDLEANFVYFFTSPTGEIMMYRSMFGVAGDPARQCYIDQYESEEAFLAGHTHLLCYVEASEATCTEPGRREYWYCTECEEYYADQGQTLLSSVIVAPILAHTPVEIPATEGTCVTRGTTAGSKCAVCDKILEEPQMGNFGSHSYSEWQVTLEPTCSQKGSETRVCLHCGQEQTWDIPATYNHEWGEWVIIEETTCIKDGYSILPCKNCDAKHEAFEKANNKHNYGEWMFTRMPTCSAAGEEKCTCRDCGAEAIQETPIKKDAHTYGEWRVVKESTCVAAGSEVRTCKDCGAQDSRALALRETHKYGAWSITKEPTCVATGSEERKCEDCGNKETRTLEVKIGAHEYGAWTVTKAPTCVATGAEERECKDCGNKETRVLEVTRETHEYGEWNVVQTSTCIEAGKQMRRCKDCGAEEVQALALRETHEYGAWGVVQASTCIVAGTEARYCSDCGAEESRTLDIGNHEYGDWVITLAPTSKSSGEEMRKCIHCSDTEIRVVASLPAEQNNPLVIVIAIGAGVGVGCGCTALLLRKRK